MKTISSLAKIMICGSVCLVSVDFTQPANAQTLFEKLFPQAAERRRARLRARQRALQPPVAVKKVAAPKYYNYAPIALKKYKFGKLSKTLANQPADELPTVWTANETFPSSFEAAQGQQELRVGSFEAPAPQFSFEEASRYLDSLSLMSRKGIIEAMTAHYSENPAFLWVDKDGQPNWSARSIIIFMEKADSFGLNASDYLVQQPEKTDDFSTKLRRAMEFEMSLTASALLYMADAKHGKINPNKISGYHDFPANKPNFKSLMTDLAGENLALLALSNAHPQDASFEHMKSELAKLRKANIPTDSIRIKSGTFLKPGQSSDQLPNIVAAIKKRGSKDLMTIHGGALENYEGGQLYSEELVKLVKAFQREKKLGPDGIIGRNTIAKLTGVSPESKIDNILLAMERLRWHPSELGNTHVFINQPAYRATYMRDGKPKLSMRAIVGKKSNQTSFFYDEIETVVFNPYWGIPRSILVNEYLPKLRSNPFYLDERGYELTDRTGTQVASSSVDWWSVGDKPPFDVRQPPGPKNALGEVKILFPNKHAIYMHDTPSRSLFKRSSRALSHGCVRLHKPKAMAAAVLGSSVKYVQSQIDAGQNKRQAVKNRIPVYVAYFTAWPTSEGEMQYFPDIYGRDRALMKAMNITRKIREKALTG